ncbi:MAG: hypothetical protein ABSD73_10640 [Candidatus Bathyarchaeia archaeon]
MKYKKCAAKTLLPLIFVLACIVVAGRAVNVKASNTTPSPQFDMMMQLEIYSIDLKTETLYSSYYSFTMYTTDPSVQCFRVAVLQPDMNQGLGMTSWNSSGEQLVSESISTDPQKVAVPWQWHMNPIRNAGLGTPFDYYELSSLIAVNMSTHLMINDGTVIMPVYLRGDWVWSSDISAEKLVSVPTNETLRSWGLSPERFYQYGCENMPDFYLFKVSLSAPAMKALRMTVAFLLPSLALLGVLSVTTYYRRRLERGDFLAIFVGAGLFTLSFLVSFYQYAPPDVFTWEELLLIVDFVFASILAVYSIVKRE